MRNGRPLRWSRLTLCSKEFKLWALVSLFTCLTLATTASWSAQIDGGIFYVYRSETTDKYFKSQNQSYAQITKRWNPYLKKYGEYVKSLSRKELLGLSPPGVLILPTAVALDLQERAAIAAFVEKGGALLGNGLVGTRDENGKFTGLDFLHSIFRVKTHGFFHETEDSYLMPFGDGPVTWPIPAARRMPIAITKDSLLRISAPNEAAVVMDWARSMHSGEHGVMAFDEKGMSRVAYLSPPDNAWPNSRDGLILLDATLAWLRREPQAFKAAWPQGYVASHLIEMDTEDQFYSAPSFAKDLESEGFKGTFYSLTSEAAMEPDLVRDLMNRGHEIAYHADVHFGFKGDSAGEQELRIRFMKQQMQGVLGDRTVEVTGFRAPTESYDVITENLLRKHGILHHAADESASEDRLPFFSLSESGIPASKALVILPRTQLDDVSFVAMKLTPEEVNIILNFDLNLTVRSGSFGLLSVHSQNYVKGGLMQRAMGEYIRKVANYRDSLWVTRGDEITHWWRQREAVQVSQRWQDTDLEVSVNNTNSGSVAGLTVFVTLPAKNASFRVSSSPKSTTVRVKAVDAFRTALVFDSLPPGATQLRVSFP